MTRTCVSCGTRTPEGAIFCNRCGARLPPADLLTCPRCGKTSPDRQSRFCDRCGSQLGSGGNTLSSPPKTPAPRGMTCPACGFENSGGNRFYCQSCGAYLPKREAVPQHIAGEAEVPAPLRGGIRIVPDGMDELRQSTASVRPARPVIPRKVRHPAQPGPVDTPAVRPEPPRKRRREAPKGGALKPDRRIVYGAAAVIILIVIIAAYILSASGGGTTDAQAPGSRDSSDSGLFESFLAGILPNETPVSAAATPAVNRAVPVFTNTPPKRLTYRLPDPDSY